MRSRSRPGRSSVHVEEVAKVHETINKVPFASARYVSRTHQLPNPTVCKILRSVFYIYPYLLLAADNQKRIEFSNELLIHYDNDDNRLFKQSVDGRRQFIVDW